MNKKQLEYVMDELGFVLNRREAMRAIILCGATGYVVEKTGYAKKGTATRDAKKCRDKWVELVRIHGDVNLLEGDL